MPRYTSSIIKICVGGPNSPAREPRPITFHVHRDILTASSPFFAAALSGHSGWSEGRAGIIRLPEDRVDDVAFFLRWLYRRHSASLKFSSIETILAGNGSQQAGYAQVCHPLSHSAIDPAIIHYVEWKAYLRQMRRGPRPKPPTIGPLIRLYILADKYDVGLDLRPDILQRLWLIRRVARAVPDKQDIALIWKGLGHKPQDALRDAVVEMYARLKWQSMSKILGSEIVTATGDAKEGANVRFMAGNCSSRGWQPGFLSEVLLAKAKAAAEIHVSSHQSIAYGD